MNKKQMQELKKIIEQKCQELRNEATIRKNNIRYADEAGTAEDSTYSFHMADQGSDTMEKEQQYIFATREGNFLYHLEMALERINSGDYGICVQCNEDIGFERLLSVPHARLCIKCKSKEEMRR